MAKVKLFNQTGEAAGEMDLADATFGVTPKVDVVHQVFVSLMANAREAWADTKGRGEVRGGGKKPWKQKGTGRARHGSIRSPIWKGGGVTFGPLSIRNYKQKINKKTNALAVKMCLSDKLADARLVVVESLPTDAKTKTLSALRAKLPGAGRTALIVTTATEQSTRQAVGNLSKTEVVRAAELNVADLLQNQYIIATRAAVQALEKRLN